MEEKPPSREEAAIILGGGIYEVLKINVTRDAQVSGVRKLCAHMARMLGCEIQLWRAKKDKQRLEVERWSGGDTPLIALVMHDGAFYALHSREECERDYPRLFMVPSKIPEKLVLPKSVYKSHLAAEEFPPVCEQMFYQGKIIPGTAPCTDMCEILKDLKTAVERAAAQGREGARGPSLLGVLKRLQDKLSEAHGSKARHCLKLINALSLDSRPALEGTAAHPPRDPDEDDKKTIDTTFHVPDYRCCVCGEPRNQGGSKQLKCGHQCHTKCAEK